MPQWALATRARATRGTVLTVAVCQAPGSFWGRWKMRLVASRCPNLAHLIFTRLRAPKPSQALDPPSARPPGLQNVNDLGGRMQKYAKQRFTCFLYRQHGGYNGYNLSRHWLPRSVLDGCVHVGGGGDVANV
ncbi:hypothetical protein BDK51DRAFT_36725 [Blyttiomyces helicus]|uniref:Uncharacterized protein n=1 Tax=Blyttiomyces helicus TaxID=388810 RepID=A0A4P9WEM9_9FUNG|nr:hypothetical protein BDK51DRAFT_36725 [Blyttiomyces helicus]|eukprot:RKO91181.1 hypothetical protein BDK51DRAFT_36725 [Blyttiomyces helicus]